MATKTMPIREFRNEPTLDFGDPKEVEAFRKALDDVKQKLGRTYPLIIGGQEVSHDKTFDSINPAHPSQVVGRHAVATAEDVDAAVKTAEAAFPGWSSTSPEERANYLHRAADLIRERRRELGALMVYEVGKAWDEADGEVAEAIDLMTWYANEMVRLQDPVELTPWPGERTQFYYVPLGVGAIISPWNFPMALTTGMMTAAVVAGNTVVVKPASTSATSVAWLLEIFREVGLPDGVINYLTGPGGAIGDALVDHPRIRFVAFTGSKEVGIRIYERAAKVQPGQIWLKRVQLEMGGKNGIIVDETADLDAAAKAIVTSAFGFQGQKCSAGSRAILVDSIYEQTIPKILERTDQVKVGDPIEPDVVVGPVIDANAEKKIMEYIEIGKKEGRLLRGGEKASDEGYIIEPTIFADVDPNARIAQEEIFGPVLAIIRAKDFEDALKIANGTEFGLTGSAFTNDPQRKKRVEREFHVGNLYINRKSTGAMMGVHPFGGFNMSGTDSKAGGPDYLLFFMQGKALGEVLTAEAQQKSEQTPLE